METLAPSQLYTYVRVFVAVTYNFNQQSLSKVINIGLDGNTSSESIINYMYKNV